MSQETKNQIKALDLMILDLQTIHSEIRIEAKNTDCEKELNEWKNNVLDYLRERREAILTN